MSVTKRHEPYRSQTEPAPLAANERRLWVAVLESAYSDDKAGPWFADGVVEVGSFMWICDVLDLNPEVMRRPVSQFGAIGHRVIG